MDKNAQNKLGRKVSDDGFMFLIRDDKVLFSDYSVFLQHEDWAKSLGIVDDEFNNMVRGTCAKTEGKWRAIFYYNYDREDGRCAAAARKFAPVIMKYCKTSSLEILSDEEPFTIHKEKKKEREQI
ncbi:hypothetical protein R84B8_01331 [Treponema sp. R8-4-B8]